MRFCFPLMNTVLNSAFLRFAAFSAAVSFRLRLPTFT